MIAVGTIVRRRNRRKKMIVLECTDERVVCGWIDKGRFFKRSFTLSELNICTPYSNFWPVT
ncbi:hypothetical protein B9D02_21095 (plasmid) [Pantoea vagans]|uniref:DUF4222 domain-containing protein n=1 Tax=Pantoea eucalypti TaxID=470933 RepID=A0ABY2ZMK0_9GAMM|nr:hypothetical protein B9D02_21095 [Pantoea vagans]TPD93516.1 hypothetical protein FJP68_14070 [Pantoea vagans]TPV39400.1 hypothetical protein FJW02_05645 [Pantoea eucalypti]